MKMIVALAALLLALASPLAGYAQNAAPPLDAFNADALGLLSAPESQFLSTQANSGLNSATKFQLFLQPTQYAKYKTIFDTGAMLTNFPLPEKEQKALNAKLGEYLSQSKRVTVVGIEQAQAALYTTVSLRRLPDASVTLEVMVAVSDWAVAQKRGGDGIMPSLARSTIWAAVTRQKLPADVVSSDGQVLTELFVDKIPKLFQNSMSQLLLAF